MFSWPVFVVFLTRLLSRFASSWVYFLNSLLEAVDKNAERFRYSTDEKEEEEMKGSSVRNAEKSMKFLTVAGGRGGRGRGLMRGKVILYASVEEYEDAIGNACSLNITHDAVPSGTESAARSISSA